MFSLLDETKKQFIEYIEFIEMITSKAIASNTWPENEREALFAVKRRKKFSDKDIKTMELQKEQYKRECLNLLSIISELSEEKQTEIIMYAHAALRTGRSLQMLTGVRAPIHQEISGAMDSVAENARSKKQEKDATRIEIEKEIVRKIFDMHPCPSRTRFVDENLRELNAAAEEGGLKSVSRTTWLQRAKVVFPVDNS